MDGCSSGKVFKRTGDARGAEKGEERRQAEENPGGKRREDIYPV